MSDERPPADPPPQYPVPQWEPPPPAQPPAPAQYPPTQQNQYPPAPQQYPPAPQQYPPAPQQYPPAQYGPPPAKPRRTGRTWLIVGLIVVLLLGILGVGAVFANASLTSTYSPQKAVTDYLAAQKKGDAAFMAANANYLKGDGSYSQYFDQNELTAMLAYPENTDISDVKVTSMSTADSSTSTVNVTMLWHGHQLTRIFTAHKDPARVHYSFYNSWRVDIPYASIHITTPNQPGSILVDGLPVPAGATADIQVIQGFHKVTMTATDLYASASAEADGIDGNAKVVFPSTISPTALAAAKSTINRAFRTCDKVTNAREDCLGRTYHAPNRANTIYFFTLPGYGDVSYTTYVRTLTSDPTVKMKAVVEASGGKVSTSGTCAFTLTINGSKKYKFKGTWKATLTMSGGSFGYDLFYDCMKSKA